MPSAAAARVTAHSASGCTWPSNPTGAVSAGAVIGVPSTVVERSRSMTVRSMRGTIRQRAKASRFAATVRSLDAPPAM